MSNTINFSFGIITDGSQDTRVQFVVNNIISLVPNPDIIIVSGSCPTAAIEKQVRWVQFNELIKPMWITKKKNLITKYAKHEYIVYMHDYIILKLGWYEGMQKFCDYTFWQIMMNRIELPNSKRYRDWVYWEKPGFGKRYLAPYANTDTENMYISGAYWIAKKEVMLEEPLDERLTWGGGEDVEWSKRVREKYQYEFNPYSCVQLLKMKEVYCGGTED